MGHGDGSGEAKGEGRGHGVGEGQGRAAGKGEGKRIGVTLCVFIIVVLVVIGLFALNITKIIMGGVYLHDCPLQRMVPIYLIVSGCMSFYVGFLKPKKTDESESKGKNILKLVLNIIGGLGLLFNFIWLICGTVWVFGNYSNIMDSCPGSDDCCNERLIKFALAVTIFDWIIIGIVIIAVIIFIIAIVCAVTSSNKVDGDA